MAVPLDYGPGLRTGGTPVWLWVLCTVSVLALLVGVCAPQFSGRPTRARQAAARADIDQLVDQLHAFKQDVGAYPTAAEGLGALVDRPAGAARWDGPYAAQQTLIDPWGRPYEYVPPSGSSPPRVLSRGPDGVSGTKDDIGSP